MIIDLDEVVERVTIQWHQEPEIIMEEAIAAIKRLKSGKAAGKMPFLQKFFNFC